MDVTALMLADDATEAGGKLYIHGAGWDSVHFATLPGLIARMALVLTLKIDYAEALQAQKLIIDLVDEDGQRVPSVAISGSIKIGHPPGIAPGDPQFVSQAIRLESLAFDRAGSFSFRLFVGGETPIATIPFRITTN